MADDNFSADNPGNPPCNPSGSFSNFGPEPTGPTGDTTPAPSDTSDCLCRAATAIEDAIKLLTDQLNSRIDTPFGDLNELVDKIIEEIRKRFEGPVYSVGKCRQMVADGLQGTLEYSIRCANDTIKECNTICTGGDPATEGKCCDTCGQEKCICKDGSCIPDDSEDKPEEPEEKTKYAGWCNSESGTVLVRLERDGSPGSGYYQVSLEDSERDALAEGEKSCAGNDKFPTFPIDPPTPSSAPWKLNQPECDIEQYHGDNALIKIASNADVINLSQANNQFYAALGRFGIGEVNLENAGEVLMSIYRRQTESHGWLVDESMGVLATALGCHVPAWRDVMIMMGQIEAISSRIGIDVSAFTKGIRYALNARCRQQQLSADQALAAYLANAITPETFDKYMAINNVCVPATEHWVEASRAKPIPNQLAVMRHRKLISPSEYDKGMRQMGYTKKRDVDLLWKSSFQVPTMSDIIRFMVRDADDNDLATQLDLDNGFTSKYRRQLKQWSEDQGIPEIVAQYAWRAHWNIPSPGQLFTFWHRLRYDDKFGGKDKLMKDIRAALIQQDILPYWHEHYLAVSFRPLTRVDVRRAFNIGAMDEEAVEKSYLDLGYSDENAKVLTKFTRKLRDDGIISHKAIKLWTKFAIDRPSAKARMIDAGLPEQAVEKALIDTEISFASSAYASAFARGDMTRDAFVDTLTNHGVSSEGTIKIAELVGHRVNNHVSVKSYVIGGINGQTALSQMTFDGVPIDVAEKLLSDADMAIDQAFTLQCQRGIKRRYLLGEIDDQQARNELTKRGTVIERANKLVDWWQCEKSSTGKHIAASKLCDWLAKGTITSLEFVKRLETIGYSRGDANNMLDDCLVNISVKRMKQAKKEADEDARDETKYQAAQKRAAAQTLQANNKLAAAREKAAQARKNREKQLLIASQKMAKKCSCEIYDTLPFMRSEQARIESQFGLGIDESLQILIVAVEAWPGGEMKGIQPIITAMAETAASVPLGSPSAEAATLDS